jgi:hypothetical protein
MLTALRKLCGQRSTGPSGVAAQSSVRMSAPSSPPPASQVAAGLAEGLDRDFAIVLARAVCRKRRP